MTHPASVSARSANMFAMHYLLAAIVMVFLVCSPAHGVVHHDLAVTLDPSKHYLEAENRISLPKPVQTVTFTLYAKLALITGATTDQAEGSGAFSGGQKTAYVPCQALDSPAARLEAIELDASHHDGVPLRRYHITFYTHRQHIALCYRGKIHHPLTKSAQEYARSFGKTPGTIGEEGVFLAHTSHWYPQFPESSNPIPGNSTSAHGFITFQLETRLPVGWESVSQGERIYHLVTDTGNIVRWTESAPQEEIYLIAAPFHVYHQAAGSAQAMVYLRQPDPAMTRKYLDATAGYLEMYRQLIGPYPYAKFALVENFWETGYGMPSFTLRTYALTDALGYGC